MLVSIHSGSRQRRTENDRRSASGQPVARCRPRGSDTSHSRVTMSRLPDRNEMAELFRRLAARDHRAFNEIVTHLWGRLRAIAKVRLKHQPRLAAAYDEEDAVQSGVTRMWEAILAGQQSPPDGVDEFLRLARTIIARRIMARARAERTGKRNPASNPEPAWSAGPLGPYMPDDLN